MEPFLFGAEAEYGATLRRADGSVGPPGAAAAYLVDEAHRTLVHLDESRGRCAGSSAGMFLENGARLYRDCGHVEYSTPETDSPDELVRHILAGDRIVARLADSARQDGGRVDVFKGGVDYASFEAPVAYGRHESYLVRRYDKTVRAALASFLASRVVIAGGGGWDPYSPGLRFTLSPRASFITCVEGMASQHDRPIVHLKDESLARSATGAGPYIRAHLIVGDGQRSERAMRLTFGATALVLASLASGAKLPGGARLRSPVEALKAFSGDPTCRAAAASYGSGPVSALSVQRAYWELARRYAREAKGPSWADGILQEWERALAAAERDGAAGLARATDWAIKHALYERRLVRSAFPWERAAAWTLVLEDLARHAPGMVTDDDQVLMSPLGRLVRGQIGLSHPSLASIHDAAREFARRRRVNWADAEEFLSVRRDMMELDTRWGQIGEDALFPSLERTGVFDARLPDTEAPDAERTPPAGGRARLRGEAVRRLDRQRAGWSAAWEGVYDHVHRRRLDLSDPFVSEERWLPVETIDDLHLRRRLENLEVPTFLRRERRVVAREEEGGF